MAIHGWEMPVTGQDVLMADLFDAVARAHFKKPKPYPRWWAKPERERLGAGTRLTPEEFRRLRAAAG